MYGTTGITHKAGPVVTRRYAKFQCFTAVAAKVHVSVLNLLFKGKIQGSKKVSGVRSQKRFQALVSRRWLLVTGQV
jgi:hypothetical protein